MEKRTVSPAPRASAILAAGWVACSDVCTNGIDELTLLYTWARNGGSVTGRLRWRVSGSLDGTNFYRLGSLAAGASSVNEQTFNLMDGVYERPVTEASGAFSQTLDVSPWDWVRVELYDVDQVNRGTVAVGAVGTVR